MPVTPEPGRDGSNWSKYLENRKKYLVNWMKCGEWKKSPCVVVLDLTKRLEYGNLYEVSKC